MKFLIAALISGCSFAFADMQPSPSEYMHLNSNCSLCHKMDQLLDKYSLEMSSRKKQDIAHRVATTIKSLAATSKAPADLYSQVYFSINACAEVLDVDTYSDTVLELMDVRARFPSAFDYVFWRFPIEIQRRLVQHMKGLKLEARPKAEIPEPRDLA